MLTDFLSGRKLLKKEIPNDMWSLLNGASVEKQPAMIVKKTVVICERCGTTHLKEMIRIKRNKGNMYYCSECLGLGRVDSESSLYYIRDRKRRGRHVDFAWKGRLTSSQKIISNALVSRYKQKKHHLIHAVTGAGKTEMLFPLIYYALQKGHRIVVASPRVDVCLELHPRFQQAFPKEDISLLYGNQTDAYRYSSFVVCTTHQLLRFYHAFDLIVVDEIDAFPYADNAVLGFGTKKALKKTGRLVYLTATPSPSLLNQVSAGELKISHLSKRYHGYPLPVPETVWSWGIDKKIRQGLLPTRLNELLEKQKRQCLIFFPNIQLMEQCASVLKELFPDKRIAFVYAGKVDREEIVVEMREHVWDWLLTTTILERGVTFPNIDVFIMQAKHRVFNVASLVQISGRVGRVADYPTGHIYLFHSGKSKAMKQAIKQIQDMNKDRT
ncbi:MAG: DEAD/DEAH box helicase [Vagococcus sp.]